MRQMRPPVFLEYTEEDLQRLGLLKRKVPYREQYPFTCQMLTGKVRIMPVL